MPNTSSAKKALRSAERKRVYNVRRKREMDDAMKAVRKHLEAGNAKEADEALPQAQKAIDKAAKRGVIKQNTAARKKSRLSNTVKRAKQS